MAVLCPYRRPSSLFISLTALLIFILGCGVLYTKDSPWAHKFNEDDCVDCINYASRIDDMFRKTENVQGNRQFFRYALDVSCRGYVLASGRCLNDRRLFLKDPERYMREMNDSYAVCASIRSCP